jgi:DnaJ like chaperone protein
MIIRLLLGKIYIGVCVILLGKILGVFIGYTVTGDIVGAVIGFFLGSSFDYHFQYIEKPLRKNDAWQTEFSYLFTLLHAKFAKMDGQVTSQEVRLFQEIISISSNDSAAIREIYNLHRKTADGFENIAIRLSEMLLLQGQIRYSVLESLCAVMYGSKQGDSLHQKAFLQVVARIFSISDIDLDQLMSTVKNEFKDASSSHDEKSNFKDSSWGVQDKSYHLLGIKSTASKEEVRKAYKKSIRKYHPDKVRGNGGSDKQVKEAERRLTEINQAYADLIGKNHS